MRTRKQQRHRHPRCRERGASRDEQPDGGQTHAHEEEQASHKRLDRRANLDPIAFHRRIFAKENR